MRRNVLFQFPNLCKNSITENKQLKCCSHLHNVVKDMHIHFADILTLSVPRWLIQSFSTDPNDLKVELKDQFIDLQNDNESKMNFTKDRYDVY